MADFSHRKKRSVILRAVTVILGIAVNVGLSFLANKTGIPVYFDTVGTIGVTAAGGVFPGIMTAVLTNLICQLFYEYSVYFGIVNILIAVFSAWFFRNMDYRKAKHVAGFILAAGLIGGVSSAVIQWGIFRRPQIQALSVSVNALSSMMKLPAFFTFLVLNFLLNVLDKGLSVGLTLILLYFIPKEIIKEIKESSWKQKPLSPEEIRAVRKWSSDVRNSFRNRMTIILLAVSLGIVFIMGWIGMGLVASFYPVHQIGSIVFRVSLIIISFLVLIVSYGLRITGMYTIYPIDSIAMSVDDFIKAGDDEEKLVAIIKKMRSIDINTGDEVEKLYHAVCDMALNHTEQIRNLRRFTENTVRMQDGLIITMADMVENRDSDTGAHIQKTAAYVKIIVEGLEKKGYYAGKINQKFISDVVRSAPLHDIGKINISDKVLNKPGKLTDEEYEIIKTHANAGREIMEHVISTMEGENYLKEARNMAAYHHERWDGKGYPEGLHGEVIPLSARIMAVADVFDALTSPRVYKPAFPLEKAVSMIEEGSGTQFDPKCVEVFVEALPEVKVVLRKYNKDV